LKKLSFKDGKKLNIGGNIVIAFRVVKGQVRMVITAPKEVKVQRAEWY
jgi:sRNA-binding carbon storage regulator CsrA